MGGNYQRPHNPEPRQARQNHHFLLPVSQSVATGHDLVHAYSAQDIGSSESHFPFNGTYPSQLEFPENEDTLIPSSTALLEPTVKATDQEATTAANKPWITTQNTNLNDESNLSYVPITRPWKEQFPNPQGAKPAYSGQTQTPLAVWEGQAPFEEPFSIIGEVAMKATHRQQHGPFHQAGRLRQGGRKKRRDS